MAGIGGAKNPAGTLGTHYTTEGQEIGRTPYTAPPRRRGGLAAPKEPAPAPKKKKAAAMPSIKIPEMTPIDVEAPASPDLPPIEPTAAEDPRLQEYGEDYLGHLQDLEEGTGFAMDVMTEGMENKKAAARERAEAAAAQAGIPMPADWDAEYDRGINRAMAEEKVAREGQLTEARIGGLGVIMSPMDDRFRRLGLDLERDVAEQRGVIDKYGRDISKYGVDVQAATAANQALLGFLQSFMGMMGSFAPSMSVGGGSTYYG
jgi:hypothetical protein